MKKTFVKTLGAIALSAVLVFGGMAIVKPSAAYAVTDLTTGSSLEDTHIQLLLQIIELLKQQLAALKLSFQSNQGQNDQSSHSGLDDSDDDDDNATSSDDSDLDDDDDDNDDKGGKNDSDDDDDNDDNDDNNSN